MLKSTIALLAGVLFVSATNSKLVTEKDREDYRQKIELEHIDETITSITHRYRTTRDEYDRLFQEGAVKGQAISATATANLKTAAIQVRHNMTALKEKVHTNTEKCKKYETDVKAKRQEANNNVKNCIANILAEATNQFDHLEIQKRKALRDMESIRNQLKFCVDDLKSNPGDIYYCEYRMKWSIIEVRSDFEKAASLYMLTAEFFYKDVEARFNSCQYQYGESNFSELTKVIAANFAECLKPVEQGTPVSKDNTV